MFDIGAIDLHTFGAMDFQVLSVNHLGFYFIQGEMGGRAAGTVGTNSFDFISLFWPCETPLCLWFHCSFANYRKDPNRSIAKTKSASSTIAH